MTRVTSKDSDTKMHHGQGGFVNAETKTRSTHSLSFLICCKRGESTPVVLKDVDSNALHCILDVADEIVISRVYAK